MNALDALIKDLTLEHGIINGLPLSVVKSNHLQLRHDIDSGQVSRALMISLLKKAVK